MKYEGHPREYNMFSVSSVFCEMTSKQFVNFMGYPMEAICVIKDGNFEHFQKMGVREKVSRAFLKKVNNGRVDLKKEYSKFDKGVAEYEKFRDQPTSKYNLDTIKAFYKHYRDLICMAYVAVDTSDYIDELDEPKRKEYFKWVEKLRLREERVYKSGEQKFAPKYLNWLQKNHLKNYSRRQLKNLLFTEVLDFAAGMKIPSPKELSSRDKLSFVWFKANSKIIVATGAKAQKLINNNGLYKEHKVANQKTLTGQIAFAGKVIGKVRIILKREDLKKFKSGEVMVSPMTDPSYIAAMNKAVGFVTDEGGILSHVAIVAREMKKPCVIGTKNATKTLKDGDMVEVDANKGIVRKING